MKKLLASTLAVGFLGVGLTACASDEISSEEVQTTSPPSDVVYTYEDGRSVTREQLDEGKSFIFYETRQGPFFDHSGRAILEMHSQFDETSLYHTPDDTVSIYFLFTGEVIFEYQGWDAVAMKEIHDELGFYNNRENTEVVLSEVLYYSYDVCLNGWDVDADLEGAIEEIACPVVTQ